MRGVGFILVMLGLAAGGYLVARNMNALQGERDGDVVVEPMAAARETAGQVEDTLQSMKKALDRIDQ